MDMQCPQALSLATPPDEADGGPPHMEHTRPDAAQTVLLLLASADSPPGPSEEPSPPISLAACSWLADWQWGGGSTAAGAGGTPTLLSSALALTHPSLACCTRSCTSARRARGSKSRGVLPLLSRRSAVAPADSRTRITSVWPQMHATCRDENSPRASRSTLAPLDSRTWTSSVWPVWHAIYRGE